MEERFKSETGLEEWEFEKFAQTAVADLQKALPDLGLVGAVGYLLDQREQILQGFPGEWGKLWRRDLREIRLRMETALFEAIQAMDRTQGSVGDLQARLANQRRAARRISRRRFLKRAGMTIGATTLGLAGLGKLAYEEYATDKSFQWKPYPAILENETRLRSVWDPAGTPQDVVGLLRRMANLPRDPEEVRRLARDLRITFEEVTDWSDDAIKLEISKMVDKDFDLIVRLVDDLNPDQFSTFPVQWELVRVKKILFDMLGIYAVAADVSSQRAERIFQATLKAASSRFVRVGKDPFVEYVLVQWEHPGIDPPRLLNGLFHRDLLLFIRQIKEEARAPLLREKMSQVPIEKIQKIALPAANPKAADRYFRQTVNLLDERGKRYPTEVAFKQAVRFYQGLLHGPVRSIAVEDVMAVRYARRQLLPLTPFFRDSGEVHHVPADVLAAVALTNLMVNAFKPSYPLTQLAVALAERGGGEGGKNLTDRDYVQGTWKEWLSEHPPEIQLQDRVTDYGAGRILGASPTIGLLQIRAGRTRLHEKNVRDNNLWKRWGVDPVSLPNREINRKLLDPQWNIEAAAALYEQMMTEGIKAQLQGRLTQVPDLKKLLDQHWFVRGADYQPIHSYYGPDVIFGMSKGPRLIPLGRPMDNSGWHTYSYMVNAVSDWGSDWFLYARILALESGLFDEIPAKIVGVTDADQLQILFDAALGRDPYLRDAALRSIRDLARAPEYSNFPGRAEAARWWRDYIRRHSSPSLDSPARPQTSRGGLEERVGQTLATLAEVAKGRGGVVVMEAGVVSRRVGLEEFVARFPRADGREKILLYGEEPSLAATEAAARSGVTVVQGGLEEVAVALAGMKGTDRVGYLGDSLKADRLSQMIRPMGMEVVPLDPKAGLEEILRFLEIPEELLDRVNAVGLEQALGRLHST